jgi:hypothetical protein
MGGTCQAACLTQGDQQSLISSKYYQEPSTGHDTQ